MSAADRAEEPDADDPGPAWKGAATLVLSRHGQTVWHAENRYSGVSDIDLTDVGRAQSYRLAEWAQRHTVDTLCVSPLRRARETAAPTAARTGLAEQVLPELREVDFGAVEGQTLDEYERTDPDAVARFRADPAAHPFPRGEDPTAAAQRGRVALERIAAAHRAQTVLVVGHNTLTRLALCSLLGIPLARYRQAMPRMESGALTFIRLDGSTGTCALLAFNVPLDRATPR